MRLVLVILATLAGTVGALAMDPRFYGILAQAAEAPPPQGTRMVMPQLPPEAPRPEAPPLDPAWAPYLDPELANQPIPPDYKGPSKQEMEQLLKDPQVRAWSKIWDEMVAAEIRYHKKNNTSVRGGR